MQPSPSYGIEHMLGPFGVSHGEASCILLPAVRKYNVAKGANGEKELATKVLWNISIVRDVLEKRILREGDADLRGCT